MICYSHVNGWCIEFHSLHFQSTGSLFALFQPSLFFLAISVPPIIHSYTQIRNRMIMMREGKRWRKIVCMKLHSFRYTHCKLIRNEEKLNSNWFLLNICNENNNWNGFVTDGNGIWKRMDQEWKTGKNWSRKKRKKKKEKIEREKEEKIGKVENEKLKRWSVSVNHGWTIHSFIHFSRSGKYCIYYTLHTSITKSMTELSI